MYKFDEQIQNTQTDFKKKQPENHLMKSKKNKKNKNPTKLNPKTFELNVTTPGVSNIKNTAKYEEGYSRKLETIKLESPQQEDAESVEEDDDPDNEEVKALIAQIPSDTDDLMKFTQNLKMED